MADIKTNLRELSVIVGLYTKINHSTYTNTPTSFLRICTEILSEDIKKELEPIAALREFDCEHIAIINNGFNLAAEIIKKFNITSIDNISWDGFDSQKEEPYDITINGIMFSLKEDSFILENMGLYKLLNCFTGSTYTKRHIFNDYAKAEYDNWFDVTWEEMTKYLLSHNCSWILENSPKKSTITMSGKTIEFNYYINNKLAAQCLFPEKVTHEIFERKTSSKLREQVFSKFIASCLQNNETYFKAKKHCALVASTALAKELSDNLNYNSGLPRFLRIHKHEYYYAKTTSQGVSIYKVPSIDNFTNKIKIESIKPSVPDSQANILTTIRNLTTNETLVLRNECRFSHGQFNGSPEAKMYYENNGSLLTIYEEV